MKPSPLRVAQVITRLNIGGASLVALLVAERLDSSLFESVVLAGTTEPGEGDIRSTPRRSNAAVVTVDGMHRAIAPLDDARALRAITGALRRFRPDIVHTHMSKAGVLGRLAARLLGVPVIVHTFHGTIWSGYFDPVRVRAFRWIERGMTTLSDAIVAISARQAEEIERLGIARRPKLVEIPLGLDLEPFRHGVAGRFRSELGVPADAPLVGIVGRLVPIKAVEFFLEAAANLTRSGVDFSFVVVGDGELRPQLEAHAHALGLATRCRFVGWRDDLPDVYRDLDVVALTSRNEGLPVSLIEASASGRAVVGAAVGGVPDVIAHEETGLLVTPGDSDELARAIRRLVAEPELRHRLGEQARDRAFARHGAENFMTRTQELYLRLARGRRRCG